MRRRGPARRLDGALDSSMAAMRRDFSAAIGRDWARRGATTGRVRAAEVAPPRRYRWLMQHGGTSLERNRRELTHAAHRCSRSGGAREDSIVCAPAAARASAADAGGAGEDVSGDSGCIAVKVQQRRVDVNPRGLISAALPKCGADRRAHQRAGVGIEVDHLTIAPDAGSSRLLVDAADRVPVV